MRLAVVLIAVGLLAGCIQITDSVIETSARVMKGEERVRIAKAVGEYQQGAWDAYGYTGFHGDTITDSDCLAFAKYFKLPTIPSDNVDVLWQDWDFAKMSLYQMGLVDYLRYGEEVLTQSYDDIW